ncbi:MAG: 50S ribosome-binding GTPase [Microbispora sp.]|nr:50S ribosome-binding GTPase [Microbispora sp.]
MTDHSLCDRVRAMCAEAEASLRPGPFLTAVLEVRERLARDTLSVAVGGRLNAGKSTLVNALLGQRLAPTGATETTMVSAWFTHHHQNRILVHFNDGRPDAAVPARPGGGVPESLGYPRENISHITVGVANKRLGDAFVLVDTPGRDALSALDDYSMASIRRADALILVMPHPGAEEEKALQEFRRVMAGSRLSAANVVGVLSQIDRLGDGTAPPDEQRRIGAEVAARGAQRLNGLVCEVVPVATKLAQAARCQTFTDKHERALRTLATADPQTLEDMLYSEDDLLNVALDTVPVDRETRRELLDLLGFHGIREALAAIDAGAADLPHLLEALRERSGITRLLDCLHERFLAAADALRCDSAATLLEQALDLAQPDERDVAERLSAQLSRLRREPELRRVELAEVSQAHARGDLPLSPEQAGQLQALMTGTTTARRLGLPDESSRDELRRVAEERARGWRVLESRLPRRAGLHAALVREIFEHLHLSLA